MTGKARLSKKLEYQMTSLVHVHNLKIVTVIETGKNIHKEKVLSEKGP